MTLHVVHLKQYPIFEQLGLEEALMRSDTRNWCLINEGSPPAIVMGISGKAHELIEPQKMMRDPIAVIKRFSGGGTVVVDQNTLFVTFIFQKDAHSFPAYPEAILKWSAALYEPIFQSVPFELRENDYVIGQKKCGGNALYIQKNRWLHHTSFLWDFRKESMQYLLYPQKTPKYRDGRSHEDFLCKLCNHFPNKNLWIDSLKKRLASIFELKNVLPDDLTDIKNGPHRKTLALLHGVRSCGNS